MSEPGPRVLIAILNWNGAEDTIAAVRSAEALEWPGKSVVVLDNASQPGSVERITEACPNVDVLRNSGNLGYAGGNNIAFRLALTQRVDWVLVLNNDLTVAPDMLTRLLEAARADASLAVLGPRVYRQDAPDMPFYPGWRIDWRKWLFVRTAVADSPDGIVDVDYVQGCALLVRCDFLDRHGLFDERYHLYCEDADLCVRAHREGFRVAEVTPARAWHKGYGSSARKSPLRTYYGMRNRILFIRKLAPPENRTVLLLRLLVFDAGRQYLSAGRECVRGNVREGWAQLRALSRGLWDAARRHYGIGPGWLFERHVSVEEPDAESA